MLIFLLIILVINLFLVKDRQEEEDDTSTRMKCFDRGSSETFFSSLHFFAPDGLWGLVVLLVGVVALEIG